MTREQWTDVYIALWWLSFVGFVWIGGRWSGRPRFRRDRRHFDR